MMMEPAKVIFEAKDPKNNYITLYEEQFNKHIIRDSSHTEFVGKEFLLREAIESPDGIYFSKNSNPPLDERYMYVKKVPAGTYTEDTSKQWCTKVISSMGGNRGEIITAFAAIYSKPIQGTEGDPIYESSNNN